MADHELIRLLDEAESSSEVVAQAYLSGATHDGTFNPRHGTTRFCQADRRWLVVLHALLRRLGQSGWIYKEGRDRNVWVLETCWRASHLDLSVSAAQVAYVRSYFDTEGGIPRSAAARFYVQFVQKNRPDLELVRDLLEGLAIACGQLHNPSHRVDPNYWRFFVRSRSHDDFAALISSWHPRKRPLLDSRLEGRPLPGPDDSLRTEARGLQDLLGARRTSSPRRPHDAWGPGGGPPARRSTEQAQQLVTQKNAKGLLKRPPHLVE